MILLMFLVVYARFYLTKILNAKSNPLLERPSVSKTALRGTILQHKADLDKCSKGEEFALKECLDKIKTDVKHASAVTRSNRVRQNANWLCEDSLKMRKQFFTAKETGYLQQTVKFNQMANMMSNPDMMTNMIK
jgi:hypothetical protein